MHRPILRAALVLIALAACTNGEATPDAEAVPAAHPEYLIGPRASLQALPTEGPAWDALVAAASADLVPDLADQEQHSAPALAAALVHARTGDEEQRRRVAAALDALPGTEDGARTLAVGRQLAGWVLAADLIGYREPAFVEWLGEVRSAELGGHGRWRSLVETNEETASNWGTLAGASRLAASLYLGDESDVAATAAVLRGWLGAADAWPSLPVDADRDARGFLPTQDFDRSWACAYPDWTPVNGACGLRDGALVEDISRGDGFPRATADGLRYSWEALQGAILQAVLLSAAGDAEVWTLGDGALRRAVAFLERNGGYDDDAFDPIHAWVPWAIVAAYGEGTATVDDVAGAGRSFGFADWLAPLISGDAGRSG